MSKLHRLAGVVVALLIVAVGALPAAAGPARPAQPRTAVTVTTGASTASCPSTTVTDTAPVTGIGWFYRVTHTTCSQMVGGYDCIQVDRVNPAAAQPVVNVQPKYCLYTRLR